MRKKLSKLESRYKEITQNENQRDKEMGSMNENVIDVEDRMVGIGCLINITLEFQEHKKWNKQGRGSILRENRCELSRIDEKQKLWDSGSS